MCVVYRNVGNVVMFCIMPAVASPKSGVQKSKERRREIEINSKIERDGANAVITYVEFSLV